MSLAFQQRTYIHLGCCQSVPSVLILAHSSALGTGAPLDADLVFVDGRAFPFAEEATILPNDEVSSAWGAGAGS